MLLDAKYEDGTWRILANKKPTPLSLVKDGSHWVLNHDVEGILTTGERDGLMGIVRDIVNACTARSAPDDEEEAA